MSYPGQLAPEPLHLAMLRGYLPDYSDMHWQESAGEKGDLGWGAAVQGTELSELSVLERWLRVGGRGRAGGLMEMHVNEGQPRRALSYRKTRLYFSPWAWGSRETGGGTSS